MKTTLYGLTGYTRAERVMRWGDTGALLVKGLYRALLCAGWLAFVFLLTAIIGGMLGLY